jgi:DNA-binding response OmpR family regulator
MCSCEAKPRVYVVDDDDDTRQLLVDLFVEAEFDVVSFESARPALEAARARAPVAIITDLTLPDMSGEELAKAVRSEPRLAHVLFFATTGRDVARGAEALFARVLTKPFDAADLVAIVTAATADAVTKPE